MKQLLIFFFFILILQTFACEVFYPTTINEMDLTIRLYGFGNINGLREGQEVLFQTLTFQETDFQKVEIIREELSINNNIYLAENVFDEYNNKHARFTIKENGNFNYEIIARIQTTALFYNITDTEIGKYPENLKIFTQKSELIESENAEIQIITKNKLKTNSFIETLEKTILWVNDYVEYAEGDDFQKYYLLQKSAIDTLFSKKGVCDEFANLAAALLRSKNIPTRIIMGPTFDGKEWGNHAWIETYHQNFGWIPSDPTFREIGFVDGTHIKMGAFKDITEAQAKAIYPTNVELTFQTQTIPEVEIHSKKFFSHVTLNWDEKNFKTNQWNELIIEVTNNTKGILTTPVKILENYENIFFDKKTKSITLKENETNNIVFRFYPNINLNPNEKATGTFTMNSLTKPFEINFEIEKGEEKDNGQIIVEDITPLLVSEKIFFEINISNNTIKEEKINIEINEKVFEEILKPFQKKIFLKEFDLIEEEYLIKIKTNYQNYEKTIIPIKQKITIIEEKPETIIRQEIETPIKQEPIINLFELSVFGALLMITIILLIVFSIKKRYV